MVKRLKLCENQSVFEELSWRCVFCGKWVISDFFVEELDWD